MLTTTRTRTQSALTALAARVADVHGELAYLEGLCARGGAPERVALLMRRRDALEASRDALYLTLNQFDPELDPGSIGLAEHWRRRFGKARTPRTFELRYIEEAVNSTGHRHPA